MSTSATQPPGVSSHPVGTMPSPTRGDKGSAGAVRHASANFWREAFYWWTAKFPPFVLLARPFFLWFALRFSKALRDGPTANARRLLGGTASDAEVERLRRAIVRSAYTNIYELGRAVRSSPEQLRAWVERIDGQENYRAARKHGRGAILVTAHLGPFEIGVSPLTESERKIHVVYQHDDRASFDRLRASLRRKLGIVEWAIDDDWTIWARLRDCLMADEVVLIQGDRVMPGQRGVEVPFLGGHILLPPGPVKLAMLTGSPIIPVFSVRTRVGRCRVIIDEAIHVVREPGRVTGDHPAIRLIAAAIERQVQAHPEQWAMFERVWIEDRASSSS